MPYLDHNSTTMVDPSTYIAMLEAYQLCFLNPSSSHSYGRKAKNLLEDARLRIRHSIGTSKYKMVFTPSGTMSNNLVLKSFYDRKILISSVEHSSVYEHFNVAPNIQCIPVDLNGLLELDSLEKALKGEQPGCLVSVIYANNETGVVQNISAIAAIARKYGALIHSDFSQAPGKIRFRLDDFDLDFVTIAGHKFGSPIGTGALFYKNYEHLAPLAYGGGQEDGLHSGTQDVIGTVGMAHAIELVNRDIDKNIEYMLELREYLENQICNACSEAQIVGKKVERICNTSMIIMPGVSNQLQIAYFDLKEIAISNGSACSSAKIGPSRILRAMHYSSQDASSCIRVSTSKKTTKKDIDLFVEHWVNLFQRQQISTNYESKSYR